MASWKTIEDKRAGIRNPVYGSRDPDPSQQDVTDPETLAV